MWVLELALDIKWGLLFVLWLSLPCQGPGVFPSCWSRSLQICLFLRCISELWCEVDDRIGVLPLGEEPLSIPLPEVFTSECALLYHLSPIVWAHKVHIVGTALSPISTLGMPAIGPGIPKALFSQGHQCKVTEVRSQDCSSHSPGPAVGAM